MRNTDGYPERTQVIVLLPTVPNEDVVIDPPALRHLLREIRMQREELLLFPEIHNIHDTVFSGLQNPQNTGKDLVQFRQEFLVVGNLSEIVNRITVIPFAPFRPRFVFDSGCPSTEAR